MSPLRRGDGRITEGAQKSRVGDGYVVPGRDFVFEIDCDPFHKVSQAYPGPSSAPRFVRPVQNRLPRAPGAYDLGVSGAALNRLPLVVPGLEEEFRRIEVRRSGRRRKTVSAEIVGDVLVVSVPDRLSRAEEHEWVSDLAVRMSERKRRDRLNARGDLQRRATELSRRYLGGVRYRDIVWAPTQRSRWGSCAPEDGSIRLSLALAGYPAWVRDYVIVHELAHLVVPDHSGGFWELVNRYPLTERARGFLIAKGMEDDG
jgi:predicted metal-dependent hydrolase